MAEPGNGVPVDIQGSQHQRRNYFKILVLLFSFGNEALREVITLELQGLTLGKSIEEYIDSEIGKINDGEVGRKVQRALWSNDENKFKGLQKSDFGDLYNIIWYIVPNFHDERKIDRIRRWQGVDALYDERNALAHKNPPAMDDQEFSERFGKLRRIIVEATVEERDLERQAEKEARIDTLINADWDSEEVFGIYKKIQDVAEFTNQYQDLYKKGMNTIYDNIFKRVDKALTAVVNIEGKLPTEILDEPPDKKKDPPGTRTDIRLVGTNKTVQSWVMRWVNEIKSPQVSSSSRLSFESSNTSLPLWGLERSHELKRAPVVKYSFTMLDKIYRNNSRFNKCRAHLKEFYKEDSNVVTSLNGILQKMMELGVVDMLGNGKDKTSYKSIFQMQIAGPHRAVISAGRGAGKSSLAVKMTHDWASQDKDDDNIPFVPLLLKMEELRFPISIMHALKSQLFKESDLSIKAIYKIVKSHQEQLLLVLDGLDDIHEYCSEISQLVAGKWMPKLNILITTSPVTLDKLILPLFRKYRINFREEDMTDYLNSCIQDVDKNKKLKTWLDTNKTFSFKLLHEPLLLSYLCGEWLKDDTYASPEDLCRSMVDEHLHIEEGDNRELFNFLALCATIYDKNVFLPVDNDPTGTDSDKNVGLNNNNEDSNLYKLTLSPFIEVKSPLFHCQNVIMNDKTYYELFFHSPTIQAYLARCALISSKSLLGVLQKQCFPMEYLQILIKVYGTGEGVIPNMKVSTFSRSRYVAFEMRGMLSDYVKQLPLQQSEREQKIMDEIKKMTQMEEYADNSYMLAFDTELHNYVGISSHTPNKMVEALEDRDADNKVILYLAFKENEWKSIKEKTSLLPVLVDYLKHLGDNVNFSHGFNVNDLRLASHHTINQVKEMVITYGSEVDSASKDVTILWDYQDIWRDVWNKLLAEIKGLARVSVCPFKMNGEKLKTIIVELKTVKLKELDLSGIHFRGVSGIGDLLGGTLSKMVGLEKLNLAGCRIEAEQMVKIIAGLKGIHRLLYLNLQQNNLEKAPEELIMALGSNQRLQYLNIRDSKIIGNGMEQIFSTLYNKNFELRHLDIGTNVLPKKAGDELLKVLIVLDHLEKFLLNNVRPVSKMLEVLIKTLASLATGTNGQSHRTKITLLDMSNATNVTGLEDKLLLAFPRLETINLSNLSISTTGFKKIIETLNSYNVKLKSIDFSKNSIGNQGVQEMCKLDLKRVEHLDLHCCRISYDVLGKLFNRFDKGLLKWVDVSDNYLYDEGGMIISQLSFATRVEHLNLKHCRMGPKGIGYLCKILRTNSSLRFLDLSRNIFAQDEAIVTLLAESLISNLRHLGIAACGFVTKSLETLTRKLTNTSHMKSISLANNLIIDNNGEILTFLNRFPNLEKLDMAECYATETLKGLFDCFQKRPLKYLDFSSNPYDDKKLDIIAFLKETEFLQHFDLKCCQFNEGQIKELKSCTVDKLFLSFLRHKSYTKRDDYFLDVLYCEFPYRCYMKVSFQQEEIKFESEDIFKEESLGKPNTERGMYQLLGGYTGISFVSNLRLSRQEENVKAAAANSEKEGKSSESDGIDYELLYIYSDIKSLYLKDLLRIPSTLFARTVFLNLKLLLCENCLIKNELQSSIIKLNALQCLGFVDCNIDDTFMESILQNFDSFPHLSELRIHRSRISGTAKESRTPVSLKCMNNIHNLKVFSLSGVIINNDLVEGMRNCPYLEGLHIQNCVYKTETLCAILGCVLNLQNLSLVNNQIEQSENMDRLVQAMDKLKRLESFERHNNVTDSCYVDAVKCFDEKRRFTWEVCKSVKSTNIDTTLRNKVEVKRKEPRNNLNHRNLTTFVKGTFLTHLRSLNISDVDLQDAGASVLAGMFGNMPLLEELRLAHCIILVDGCTAILQGLIHLPKLTTLDLSYSKLADVPKDVIKRAIAPCVSVQTLVLHHLNVPIIDWLVVLKDFKYLRVLDIRDLHCLGKRFHFEKAERLSVVLNILPFLAILHITGFPEIITKIVYDKKMIPHEETVKVDDKHFHKFKTACSKMMIREYAETDDSIPIWLFDISNKMDTLNFLDSIDNE